jgi:hypothetical protein
MKEPAMKNVLALALLILGPSPVYADPNAPANRPRNSILHPPDVPIGSLGFPLGSYLKLEGRREDGGMAGDQTLLIETINGKRLGNRSVIWVENVRLPPPQFRCVLRGYETVRMIGDPPALEQAEKEAGENVGLVQRGFQSDLNVRFVQPGWQVEPYFVALFPVAIEDVALKSDPVAAVRAALPDGWTIKVEDGTYPPHRAAGKGKAIFLLPSYRDGAEVIVYLMPSDYRDGEKVTAEVKAPTSHPASVIGAVPSFKVYLWAAGGYFTASGWPTVTDDILKALLKARTVASRSEPEQPIRGGTPNGKFP